MYQVRIYLLLLRKYPGRGKGYYAYRLETIDSQGKLHAKEDYDEEPDITSNQLAIVAMYRAFEQLKGPCEAEVFTDSLYLRENFAQNLEGWAAGSWRNAKGEPVKNAGLWQQLREVTKPHAVRFNTDYLWPERARMTKELMERRRRDVG